MIFARVLRDYIIAVTIYDDTINRHSCPKIMKNYQRALLMCELMRVFWE